jgi:flagellar biosynthesis/type III secretory pathway protein FliH
VRPPSQFPSGLEPALEEADLLSVTRERRRDTLIEALVPRAEEEAVLAIGSAIEQFAAVRAQSLRDAEQDLIELVRVICRRVVLRELTLGTSVIEGLIQEGLEALGGGDRVTVKLGHFFTETKDGISDNLQHKGIHCVVQIDADLPPHGCLLTTELGRVDESVETRLDVLLSGLDSVR